MHGDWRRVWCDSRAVTERMEPTVTAPVFAGLGEPESAFAEADT